MINTRLYPESEANARETRANRAAVLAAKHVETLRNDLFKINEELANHLWTCTSNPKCKFAVCLCPIGKEIADRGMAIYNQIY